jgi:hypothetical protein
MPLTTAQLATLKTHLAANTNQVLYGGVLTAINAVPNNPDGNFAIAGWYNLTASPAWRVWRTNVPVKDCKKATTWTEYIGRSQGERDAWGFILSNGIVDASDPNVRQGILDCFSGPSGANTRAALTAIAKRDSTNAEKVLSTGTGSDATPATMGFEGNLSYQDVESARNLP